MSLGGFKSGFSAKRIDRKDCKFPEFLICNHDCKTVIQLISHVSGEAEFELCFKEARKMGSLLINESIKFEHETNIEKLKMQEKEDETANTGDVFKVVYANNHETPYLIGAFDGKFILTNMHSGQSNYSGNTIDELLEDFFTMKKKLLELDSITHYYFVKSYENKLSHNKVFNVTKVEK